MPVTVITAPGTYQLKSTSGYITGLFVVVLGTSPTIQFKDGPNSAGAFTTIFGASPFPLVAVANPFASSHQFFFSNGIQVIVGGTPGEIDIEWQ